MTCVEFQDRLSAYMDGELSRWKRWKVHLHLSQCPECAALKADLAAVDMMLIDSIGEAPEYLTGAVMHRLPAMPPPTRRPGLSRPVATGLVLAGMQVVALCGAYWWGFAHGSDTPFAPQASGSMGPASLIGRSAGQPPASNGFTRGQSPAGNVPGAGSLWTSPRGGVVPDPAQLDDYETDRTGSQSSTPLFPQRRVKQRFPGMGPIMVPQGAR